MDDEDLKIYAFIVVSSYRVKTVKSLQKSDKTPTQISKDIGIRVNHISNVLSDLKRLGVLICINEEKRRDRIYQLTDFGRELAGMLR